jgi:hypothetical protein
MIVETALESARRKAKRLVGKNNPKTNWILSPSMIHSSCCAVVDFSTTPTYDFANSIYKF